MQMNPMQIIQMIKGGSNPQQLIMSFLQQQNNPMANNLLQMAQNGNTSASAVSVENASLIIERVA